MSAGAPPPLAPPSQGGSNPAPGLAPPLGSGTLGGGSAHLRGAGGHRAPVPSSSRPVPCPPHPRCLPPSSVKPDPPEDLRVSPVPGDTEKLLLEWSPPASWPFPQYFPLKYHIRYAWDGGSAPQTVLPPPTSPTG